MTSVTMTWARTTWARRSWRSLGERAGIRCRSVRRRSVRRSGRARGHPADRRHAEGEGLQLGPGGPLVSWLRGLRGAEGGAEFPAQPGAAPGEHRVRLRHRLLLEVPLLPEHLRD